MVRPAVCLVFIFLAGCASSPQGASPQGYSHEQAIEVMLKDLGAPALAMNGLHIAAAQSKNDSPEKAQFFDCVFNNISEQTLRDMMIPVYKKYYTKEDALEVIELLSTPLGKKFKTSVQNTVNSSHPAAVFTPEEDREFAKYSRFFKGPVIDKMNRELKQEGKRIGMEKARPCLKFLKTS